MLEQRLGVERDRRDGVVDVVRDAARHLAERAQALLLHHRLLALPQLVVRLLQRRVELRLMSGERHVVAQLAQELTLVAGEASASLRAAISTPNTVPCARSGAITSARRPRARAAA